MRRSHSRTVVCCTGTWTSSTNKGRVVEGMRHALWRRGPPEKHNSGVGPAGVGPTPRTPTPAMSEGVFDTAPHAHCPSDMAAEVILIRCPGATRAWPVGPRRRRALPTPKHPPKGPWQCVAWHSPRATRPLSLRWVCEGGTTHTSPLHWGPSRRPSVHLRSAAHNRTRGVCGRGSCQCTGDARTTRGHRGRQEMQGTAGGSAMVKGLRRGAAPTGATGATPRGMNGGGPRPRARDGGRSPAAPAHRPVHNGPCGGGGGGMGGGGVRGRCYGPPPIPIPRVAFAVHDGVRPFKRGEVGHGTRGPFTTTLRQGPGQWRGGGWRGKHRPLMPSLEHTLTPAPPPHAPRPTASL